MFATYGGLRRRVAVLTVLSLVASVLVAATPAVAADDPEPSYEAKFDACAGASESGFTDVPAGHANAGDIDCIAYYGITKGTSATTYSPTSAVTREQMALFLTRLADLVGITVPPAGGTDFTDTGDLSAESQTAISQLAQLEITQGTSDTTFSPSDGVRRDHMALFIQRLMNIMDPITDTDGHTPSDVVDNVDIADIGSPFTDLGLVTKSAYDAITELYELDVATGISSTAYGPSSLITRASMAGFMAAMLDHSNARPAGVTIQASKASGWGEIDNATVIVSYRDDSFMPVVDQPIDIFNSEDSEVLDRKGACDSEKLAKASVGDCKWSDNDELTDDNGNIIDDGVSVTEGKTNVFYAWIGIEEGDTFDKDDADHATVSIMSMKEELSVKVSNDLPAKVGMTKVKDEDGLAVHLGNTRTVTITLQLKEDAGGEGADVARSGVEFRVKTDLGGDITTSAAVIETNENGTATFTVTGPENDSDTPGDDDRYDVITFTDSRKTGLKDSDFSGSNEVNISWVEDARVTSDAEATVADVYVIAGDVSVSATVTFYDQYGEKFRQARGQTVTVKFGNGDPETEALRSDGMATASDTLTDQKAGDEIPVTITTDPKEDKNSDSQDDIPIKANIEAEVGPIEVVDEATPNKRGKYTVKTALDDNNEFTAHLRDKGSKATLLFSYDSDDTFLDGDKEISMSDFEDKVNTGTNIDVIVYSDTGGRSIFAIN